MDTYFLDTLKEKLVSYYDKYVNSFFYGFNVRPCLKSDILELYTLIKLLQSDCDDIDINRCNIEKYV